jgi:predicted DNA-binding ribbon-helix-helix protein
MKSLIVKRSVVIAGHKTSVSLEDAFWTALKEIAAFRNMPLSDLIASVDREREHANLSSAIRLFILEFCRAGSATRPPQGNRVAELGSRHSVPKSDRAEGNHGNYEILPA